MAETAGVVLANLDTPCFLAPPDARAKCAPGDATGVSLLDMDDISPAAQAMNATRFAAVRPCLPLQAEPAVHSALPKIELLTDAIFVPKEAGRPFEESSGWGVYRSDGRLCDAAAYRRGGSGLIGHHAFSDVRPEQSLPSDMLFVYGGPCHQHYGHMIVSTLARLWPTFNFNSKVKFLFHGDGSPSHWFAYPHFKEIMSALKFDSSDFVNLRQPFRIPSLVVPSPAFQELEDGHLVFGELGARIGDELLPHPAPRTRSAIYLSKSRLRRGVWRIANEGQFEAELQRSGVEVIYPETLSVAEQIALMESANVVLGSMGSAMHTSLFTRRQVKLRCLCVTPHVVENYLLIDQIKRNDAAYFQAVAVDILPPTEAFGLNVRMADPVAAARAFLAVSLD